MGKLRLSASLSMLALCFAGCGEKEDRIIEQSFEQTYPVDLHARISVKNVDGSIRIYGADTHEVRIEAIKKAYGKDRLEKIAIKVMAQADSVSIDTTFPARPKFGLGDRSGTVDYNITVPKRCTIPQLKLANGEILIEGMRDARVSANLANGRLYDRNGFGDHQLFVGSGGLDLFYDWWETGAISVDAKIVDGNARAFIPGEASFHLLVSTGDGQVSSDFSEQEERHRGPLQKIDSVVGDPSPAVIRIQATSGNINVAEANP